MKNMIRITALIVALLMFAPTLVSCGAKLSGTYVFTEEVLIFTDGKCLTFMGDKVFVSKKIANQMIGPREGTYQIKGDKIIISVERGDEIFPELNGEHDFEKTDNGIKIDGVEYTKKNS